MEPLECEGLLSHLLVEKRAPGADDHEFAFRPENLVTELGLVALEHRGKVTDAVNVAHRLSAVFLIDLKEVGTPEHFSVFIFLCEHI